MVGAAVSGTVVMPLAHVACERHVPPDHLQELEAFGRIMQPLRRPQAPPGHSLVFFTRGHGDASKLCRI
jgi:hypothetical protein